MINRHTTISVLIATRNRAKILARCLDALAAAINYDFHREVLIIDNASTDDTPDIYEREKRKNRMRVRYIREEKTGLAFARNTGIESSQGDAIIFLDDDALPVESWADSFERLLCDERHSIVQGRIIPLLSGGRPSWLSDDMMSWLGQIDLGETTTPLKTLLLHGGNLGVRRDTFGLVGLFRTDLGAGAAGLGEDTEWALRAAELGINAIYAPGAMAWHVIPRARITRSAMLKRALLSGYCRAVIDGGNAPLNRIVTRFGIDFVAAFYRALTAGDEQGQMRSLRDQAEHLGRVIRSFERALHG